MSATAHVSINLRRLLLGYFYPPTKAEMTKFLLDITQPTNVGKQFLVATTVGVLVPKTLQLSKSVCRAYFQTY